MIAIIDYKAGNIRSLRNGLERVGADAVLTHDADLIRSADRVIFPGVGEASSAMDRLRRLGLDQLIPDLKQPVLGICLGLQLMCKHSEENDTEGLGIFDVQVKRFPAAMPAAVLSTDARQSSPEASEKVLSTDARQSSPEAPTILKVPQVGWNSLHNLKGPLFQDIPEGTDSYFVHSYYAALSVHTAATTDYGIPFSAALQRDNFFAVQYHPEISSTGGETLLRNFLTLDLKNP